MESLDFAIVLEADDHGNGWHSCYPAWEDWGAATCGNTREEAISNIKEALAIILAEIHDGTIAGDEVAERGGLPYSRPQATANTDNSPVSVLVSI